MSVYLVGDWYSFSRYLLGHGFTHVAAAAIVGSSWGESHINVESVGGGGFGLIGWTPQFPGQYSYLHPTGNRARDRRVQYPGVVSYILKNGSKHDMNRFHSIYEALSHFVYHYERPLNPGLDVRIRFPAARAVLHAISGFHGGGGGGGGGPQHKRVKIDPLKWYANPLKHCHGLHRERIDQGVDYGVGRTSPITAIGKAKIEMAMRSGSGWPDGGYVRYQLEDGPAAGCHVYVAENITPASGIHPGKRVGRGEVIAYLHPGGANMEMGWAAGVGTLALYHRDYARLGDGTPTRGGVNFSQLLGRLGAPQGIPQFHPRNGGMHHYNGGDGMPLPHTPRGARWPNWYGTTLLDVAPPPPLMARLPSQDWKARDLRAAKAHNVHLVAFEASSGRLWRDPHYNNNTQNSNDADMPYGAVHEINGYSHGEEQADNFYGQIARAKHPPGFIAVHIKDRHAASRPNVHQVQNFFSRLQDNMQADSFHVDRGIYLCSRVGNIPTPMDLAKLKGLTGMWIIDYDNDKKIQYPRGLHSHKGTLAREYTNGFHAAHPSMGPDKVKGLGHVPLSIVYGRRAFGLPPGSTGCKTGSSNGKQVLFERGNWVDDFLKALAVMPVARGILSGTKKQKGIRKDAMLGWLASEDTKARFNPLATTFSYPHNANEGGPAGLGKNFNSAGVKNYRTWATGIDATVQTLTQTKKFGYPRIIQALVHAHSHHDILSAVRASSWGSKPSDGLAGQDAAKGIGNGRGFFTGQSGSRGKHGGSGCPSGGPRGTVPELPPTIEHYRLDGIPKDRFKVIDDFHSMLYDSHYMDIIVDVYDQNEEHIECLSDALHSSFGITAGQVDVQTASATSPNSAGGQAANSQLSMDLTVQKHAAGDFADNVWGSDPGGDVKDKGVLHPAHFVKVTYAVYVDRPKNVKFPSGLPSKGEEAVWVDVPVFFGPISMIQADQVAGTLHIEAQGKESLMALPNLRPWTNVANEFDPKLPTKATVADLIEKIARQFGEKKFKLTKTSRRVSINHKSATNFIRTNGVWAYLQQMSRGAGYYLYYDNDGWLKMKSMPGQKSHASSTVALSSHNPDSALENGAAPSCVADLPQIAWDQSKWYNTVAVFNPFVKSNSLRGARAIVYEDDAEIGSKKDLERNTFERPMVLKVNSQVMLEPGGAVDLGERHLQAAYDAANQVQLTCLPFPNLELYDRVSLWSQNIDETEQEESVLVPDKWTLPLTPSALMTIGFNVPIRVVTVHHKMPKPHPAKGR